MMSEFNISEDSETLFSFQLLVENIKMFKAGKVSKQLVVGVRLLDFPTLLIYQKKRGEEGEEEEEEERDEEVFERGKICFFKMKLDSLLSHLNLTPVHLMVLDVKEETPKLVGTSSVSLKTAMKRIKQDLTEHRDSSSSSSSSHGERGVVGVFSLTGEKIGEMSLSYKLQSLGGNELQHVTEKNQHLQTSGNSSAGLFPPERQSETSETQKEFDSCRNETSELEDEDKVKEGDGVFPDSEDDVSVFCPPRLFFYNSAEERSRNERSQTLNSAEFQFKEEEEGDRREGVRRPGLSKTCEAPASSREKADFQIQEKEGDRGESVTRPVSAQKEKPEKKTSAAVTPNILGEALQQLPLLNALLMELSQLSGQTPHQPPSVHPNLAWIYRPASAEPSRKTKEGTKKLKSHRNCFTTLEQEQSKSCRKKLVFGTTKTFDLRMKKVKGKEREKKLCQKGSRRKSQASSLSEDVKTAVERETETEESHKLSPGNSEKASECVRSDISVRNKEESERQSQSHHSEFDRRAEDDDDDDSVSDSAEEKKEEEEEEEEYADDFNSLEPSDAYSPVSSPESSRAKTPKPPVPVPVPAPRSPPRRSLHVIRAPPHAAAALSVSSSDDADRDTSASVQTVLSRKQTEEKSRSRSDASGSSLEDEEDEEELGSLDFRKEYKHISELVANKLPGYTM